MTEDNQLLYCQNGSYRWVFEYSLYSSPARLFVLMRILTTCFVLIWLISTAAESTKHGFWLAVSRTAPPLLIAVAGLFILCLLICLISAAAVGGKRCYLYEMDNTGLHIFHLPSKLSLSRALLLIDEDITAVRTASSSYLYVAFSIFGTVRLKPRRHALRIDARNGQRCTILCRSADFDIITNFILQRIPEQTTVKRH